MPILKALIAAVSEHVRDILSSVELAKSWDEISVDVRALTFLK